MRKSGMAIGLTAVAAIMTACGGTSTADQVASSSLIVTKFNGQLNLTSTKPSALVDSSGILQQAEAVSFVSKSEIIAAQNDGNASVIFRSLDEGRNWNQISVVPGTVDKVDFVNSQVGFALARSSADASSSALYSTSNGGQTWVEVSAGSADGIGFVSAQVGFEVRRVADTKNNVQTASIVRSQDGGKTWVTVPSPLDSGVISASFSFISPTEGWLLAGTATGAGTQTKYLYQTSDAGTKWTQITKTPVNASGSSISEGLLPIGGFVNELQFMNGSVGYISLRQGGFLETSDGGRSWHQVELRGLPIQSANRILSFAAWSPTDFSVVTERPSFWISTSPSQWLRVYPPYRETGIYSSQNGLYALSQTGELADVQTSSSQQTLPRVPQGTIQVDPFHAGMMAFTPTKIYFSADGAHWEQLPVPHGWSLLQGHFVSANFGLVVANDNGPPGSAVLELTSDGGSSWQKIVTKFRPFAIDPVSPTDWWALGGTDVTFTANTSKLGSKQMHWNLYYTEDGGKSWDEFIANWPVVGGLDFVSNSEGYVWIPGKLYRTVDRGSSFSVYDLPSQLGLEGMFSMAFEPGGVGWSLGNAGYPIYHTIDAGAHWGPNP
ncbi:MAG: hypothetical protein M0Z96_04715 [Actinomycetota bacterium]|nr:hypothetical protein [Actinomycetota bacterium]